MDHWDYFEPRQTCSRAGCDPASKEYVENRLDTMSKTILDKVNTEFGAQADWAQTNPEKPSYIRNKPTIPSAQIQTDWTQTDSSALDYIKNKPSFAVVATSGSYNDLHDTPVIPTVPTKTSDLINDSDFQTGNDVTTALSAYTPASSLSTVATTGSYDDLTDKPVIPAGAVLYSTTGQNTDGAMTQKATTDALNSKTDANLFTNTVNNLQGQIDVIVASSDVKDVVGTKTELDNYDTSTLSDNDIIKVLSDSSQSDKTTYYRWSTSTSTFSLIGSEGPYYTKAETNTLLNAKADSSSLATVATSGNYNDLSNKPTIPAAQVNSDWNASSGVAEILNKPSLATVATTGAYSDLTGTPTIPTVNNATLTVTQNGTSKGTFTANASSNKTIALTDTTYNNFTGADASTAGAAGLVPAPAAGDNTKYLSGDGTWKPASQYSLPIASASTLGGIKVGTNLTINATTGVLSADAQPAILYSGTGQNTDGAMTQKATTDQLTLKANSADLATVATSGSYNDLSNKPTIPAAQVNSDWNANSGVAQILNKPTLATVATSGSYNDLSDKPAGMVILSYGSSTWNDFISAYQENRIIYCRASSGSDPGAGSQTRLAFMAYVNNATTPTEVEFQYVRSVSTKSASDQSDQVFVYKLTSAGAWTVESRPVMCKLAAGSNMGITYSNNTLTLNADAQQQADWTQSDNTKVDFIKNKPTIPTVNNSTITVTNNGTSKGTFTTNQASAGTVALDYPVITMQTTDPGEGVALAANNFIAVYNAS